MSDYVTGSDLYEYFECWRRLWNNSNLDPEIKQAIQNEESEFMKRLKEEGIRFEAEAVHAIQAMVTETKDDFLAKEPIDALDRIEKVEGHSQEYKAEKTLELMKKGVKYIQQGVIIDEKNGLEGMPDLLIRSDQGKSKFGSYQYHPADFKSSHEPEGEQIAQVVHYRKILASFQGAEPINAYVLNQSRNLSRTFEANAFVPEQNELDDKKTLEELKELDKDQKEAVRKTDDEISVLESVIEEMRGIKERDKGYYDKRKSLRKQMIGKRNELDELEDDKKRYEAKIKIVKKSKEITDDYDNLIADVKSLKQGKKKPSPTICSVCGMCEYHNHCKDIAYKDRDISLIQGLAKTKKRLIEPMMQEAGLEATIENILEHKELLLEKGMSKASVEKYVTSALAYRECHSLSDEEIDFIMEHGDPQVDGSLLDKVPKHLKQSIMKKRVLTYKDNDLIEEEGGKLLKQPLIPEHSVETQLDFEADETGKYITLIGLNVRKESESFHKAFFAESAEGESKILGDFLEYYDSLGDGVLLLHYWHYEKTNFKRMLDAHHEKLLKRFDWRLFDIEDKLWKNLTDQGEYVRHCLATPAHSLSIKTLLPKSFGFRWRVDTDVGKMDGAKCEVVYGRFREEKDPKRKEQLKRVIIDYNEDDVIGPWRLWDKIKELAKGS